MLRAELSYGFNSIIRPLTHFHLLVIDGVYIPRDNASPLFRRVKIPDKTELEVLVQRISQRVGRCLERQGLLIRDTGSDYLNLPLPEEHDPMAQLLGSSVTSANAPALLYLLHPCSRTVLRLVPSRAKSVHATNLDAIDRSRSWQ